MSELLELKKIIDGSYKVEIPGRRIPRLDDLCNSSMTDAEIYSEPREIKGLIIALPTGIILWFLIFYLT